MTTIFTLGPGASAFALEPAYEKVVCRQRKAVKKAKEHLEKRHRLSLQDLDAYCLKSARSDLDTWKIVKQGGVVGSAALEGSEALPDNANTEWIDSDIESLLSDLRD